LEIGDRKGNQGSPGPEKGETQQNKGNSKALNNPGEPGVLIPWKGPGPGVVERVN